MVDMHEPATRGDVLNVQDTVERLQGELRDLKNRLGAVENKIFINRVTTPFNVYCLSMITIVIVVGAVACRRWTFNEGSYLLDSVDLQTPISTDKVTFKDTRGTVSLPPLWIGNS